MNLITPLLSNVPVLVGFITLSISEFVLFTKTNAPLGLFFLCIQSRPHVLTGQTREGHNHPVTIQKSLYDSELHTR